MHLYLNNILAFFVCCDCVLPREIVSLEKLKPEPVLQPCEFQSDCDNLINGTCSNGICKCSKSYSACILKENFDNFLVNEIGGKCNKSEDCNIEGAECTENKCACKEDLIISTNNKKCLKSSEIIGDDCEESVQCLAKTPSTYCLNNKCVCRENMHEKNGSCYRSSKLGEDCFSNEECSLIAFSSCSADSKCSCGEKYVAASFRCLPIAEEVGDACVEDIQCEIILGEGAICAGGFCGCEDLYQLKPKVGKCVKDVLLDESCRNHSDCHQPGSGQSRLECVLGVCKCRPIYKQMDVYCISTAEVAYTRNTLLLILSFCISIIFFMPF